jgi:hypothetical protein
VALSAYSDPYPSAAEAVRKPAIQADSTDQ